MFKKKNWLINIVTLIILYLIWIKKILEFTVFLQYLQPHKKKFLKTFFGKNISNSRKKNKLF